MDQILNPNTEFEILTPNGWEPFDGVMKNCGSRAAVIIRTEKTEICATLNHRFYANGEERHAGSFSTGDLIDTVHGSLPITSITAVELPETYDVYATPSHLIVANDTISHNCDEFAFVPPNKQNEFWTSIQPVLSCVAGDTLVLTQDGFVEIAALHQGRSVGDYFHIPDLRTFGKHGLEPVSHGYVSPHSETLVIETERGLRLEVTKHHPLYALRGIDVGMTKAEQLVVGDQLRVQFGMQIFGSNVSLSATSCKTLTPEFGYLIGGMVAEGWITKTLMKTGVQRNMLSVSNCDAQFRQRYLDSDTIVPFREAPSNKSRLSVNSKELVELFEEVGFEADWKCDTKRVPKMILTAPREVQVAFLQGLFDGDGCGGGDCINLTSCSPRLLREVQMMLLNFGVISTVRLSFLGAAKIGCALPDGRTAQSARDAYSLTIAPGDRSDFLTNVGFGLERKNDSLRAGMEARPGKAKTKAIAKTAEIVAFLKDVVAHSTKTVGWFRKHGVRLDKAVVEHTAKGVITHDLLNNLRRTIIENNLPLLKPELFDELVGSFLWDRIKSITPSTNQTYDFTVPDTHSFLQNGILGSNTGGSCIITSTPKNDEDQFAQIWRGAKDNLDEYGNPNPTGIGRNDFFAVEAPWWEHPERDEDWAKPFRESLGEARFAQEFCCCVHNTEVEVIDSEGNISTIEIGKLFDILSSGR